MSDLKVTIIGAGLGGLTLAQSLNRAGVKVEVFERDQGPFDRPQGYRLHLDADAINAAKEVLPTELHQVFEATSQFTQPHTTILGMNLSVIKRLLTEDDHGAVWPPHHGPPVHANVDRATLRQILMAGLDGQLHFGKTLDHYEVHADGVTAFFEDGTQVETDVLVGADGIRSAVRRQRAPQAETVDAGITAISGRVPVAKAATLVPNETLEDIFTIATDDRKVFLGLGSVRFPSRPDRAAAALAPGVAMRPQDDYVVCIVGGRHEFFPQSLKGASGAELQKLAADTVSAWPDQAASIIRAGDAAAFFLVEMFTSVPCSVDPPTNVTLLGDAIHAMTPTLGRGANVAMRDGALLGRQLRKVAAGEATVKEALVIYEREMLDYGFAVVREAAEIGRQRMAQNLLPT
jgi:2-polyprenyl-6-methoxyphenol hydroxylase-like FAD-dependent oxidoreductase